MKILLSCHLPPLPKRPIDAHKTSAGSVCVIAGSYGMAGAAYLAAVAALRSGAGYVRMVCPDRIYPILAGLVPSAVFVPLDSLEDGKYPPAEIERAIAAIELCTAAVVGPGLGESPAAQALFAGITARVFKPMVLDASALGLMAKSAAPRGNAPRNWVITPHSGEAARLLQIDTDAVEADRPAAVAALRARSGAVAVLKGARSLVCDGSRLYENTSGNAGMATAGSGDVLAGVIGAFLAQGLQAFEAAALGVYIHGRAGDIAATTLGRGLTAPDIADSLPSAILDYEGGIFEKSRGPISR